MRINNNIGWILGVLTLLFAALPLSWRYTNRTGTGICLTLAVALLGCWIGKAWLWKKLAALAAYAKNKILNPVPPIHPSKSGLPETRRSVRPKSRAAIA
jgi:hypothetical protein